MVCFRSPQVLNAGTNGMDEPLNASLLRAPLYGAKKQLHAEQMTTHTCQSAPTPLGRGNIFYILVAPVPHLFSFGCGCGGFVSCKSCQSETIDQDRLQASATSSIYVCATIFKILAIIYATRGFPKITSVATH